MRSFVHTIRRFGSKHRLPVFLLTVFLYNYTLLSIESYYYSGKCFREADNGATNRKLDKESQNAKQFLLQEFAWGSELRELADDIVMLEYDSSKRNKTPPMYPPISKVLSPIKDEHILEIVDILQDTYYVTQDVTSLEEYAVAYESNAILDCDAMNRLERRRISPKIVHISTSGHSTIGEYYLHNGMTIDVVINSYQRADRNRGNAYGWLKADQEFELAQENLLKLLMMHGYPFVPRLYGVCLGLANGSDVTKLKGITDLDVQSISFITDRFGDQSRMCKKTHQGNSEEECLQLTGLSKLISSSEKPVMSALKVMTNMAMAFDAMHSIGILPTDVDPFEIIINKNFDVIFTSVESFVILQTMKDSTRDIEHNRLFSSTMCKSYEECSNIAVKGIMFKVGQACKETRGYCADDNRCWGVDNNVYVCIMSRWLFAKIHNGIPSSWEHESTMTKLLHVARQASPEHRCDWTTLSRGLNNILDQMNFYE